jgi:tRNA (guanine-N7-)-methyltransferase
LHANSRPVSSNQSGIHHQLHLLIERHANSRYLRPIADHSRKAFDTSITTWQAAGSAPLIIDAGCGVGLSTRKLAQRHPDCFVIGIDQSADRLARELHWETDVPSNHVLVRADLVDFWRLMLEHAIYPSHHYLLYPNPWPKKSQLVRRWHGHPVFPALLALGGRIECRSNWKIYIEEFASAVTQLTGVLVGCENLVPDADALTPFEQKYRASGHALWRCQLQLPARIASISTLSES